MHGFQAEQIDPVLGCPATRRARAAIPSIYPDLPVLLPMRSLPGCLAIGLAVVASCGSEQVIEARRSVVLEGANAKLVVDVLGGSIVDFRIKAHGLNPLRWANEGPADEPRSMSHFLCLDRWGLPSEAEAANGMPGHGEATKVAWEVIDATQASVHMAADLPMAGLRVERWLELASDGAWFRAVETVTNRNKLGRVYNIVQHPTLGPPFLDETVVVDSNASKGFMQGGSMPNPEEPSVRWPNALKDGQAVDLRKLTDDHDPAVVSFVVDAPIGWVTASNAGQGLLIGYLWRSEEYPWLNIWRRVESGRPLARGLEFGTTGLHRPFGDLVRKARVFGRPIVEYLDTAESSTRSYIGFLAEIPAGYRGVADVLVRRGSLQIHEHGAGSTLSVAIPPVLWSEQR